MQRNQSFPEHHTVVAVEQGRIAGFGDIGQTGYLDRLYIHKDFQKKGIATAICDSLEELAEADRFCAHASITARPFFEKRGYQVVKEQSVERNGVKLINDVMIKYEMELPQEEGGKQHGGIVEIAKHRQSSGSTAERGGHRYL